MSVPAFLTRGFWLCAAYHFLHPCLIETWFLDFKVLPQEAEEENSKLSPSLPETSQVGGGAAELWLCVF